MSDPEGQTPHPECQQIPEQAHRATPPAGEVGGALRSPHLHPGPERGAKRNAQCRGRVRRIYTAMLQQVFFVISLDVIPGLRKAAVPFCSPGNASGRAEFLMPAAGFELTRRNQFRSWVKEAFNLFNMASVIAFNSSGQKRTLASSIDAPLASQASPSANCSEKVASQ